MASQAIPPDPFHNFEDYPANNSLLYEPETPDDLIAYSNQLIAKAPKLFLPETPVRPPNQALRGVPWLSVAFLDLSKGQSPTKDEKRVENERQLVDWLTRGASNTQPPPKYQEDPQCRFIFLHAGNSRAPLKLTLMMFSRIMTYHQIMPAFIDFVSVFGQQDESKGHRFSGFKTRSQLTAPPNNLVNLQLGRSGQHLQLCYNLRSAKEGLNNIWSIRQTVFHHQFDLVNGNALWMSAKGDQDMQKIMKPLVKHMQKNGLLDPHECFVSTLKVHAAHCQWSTKGWLLRLEALEDNLDAIKVTFLESLSSKPVVLTTTDLENVQLVGQKNEEVLVTLQANIDILSSLREFYLDVLDSNPSFLLMPGATQVATQAVKNFSRNLKNIESDLHRLVTRAERLAQLATDKRNLVIKQLEFQASKKMEALSFSNHALSQATHDLTISTHALGIVAQREAVGVAVITIIALVYLPFSTVSAIFSTDIVKYQQSDSKHESFSRLALERFFEVSLPLTCVTLTLGFMLYRFEDKRQRKHIKEEKENEKAKLAAAAS